MKSLQLTLLGALPILVTGLVMAAPASAATPEFLQEGHVLEEGSKIELVGEEGGEALIKTEKLTIQCAESSVSGEISGPKTITGMVYKLTRCKSGELSCESAGAEEGEILSNSIVGDTEYLRTEKEVPVGLLMEPASGPSFAEFKCSSTAVDVRGSLICELGPTNVKTTTLELSCTETGGQQTWTRLEGSETLHRLEVSEEAAQIKIKVKIKIKEKGKVEAEIDIDF